MKMIEISKERFYDFIKNSPYNNYCQSDYYGLVMKNKEYEYSFVAYTDNDENILATSMFLIKKIGRFFYAYSPRGFVIDYNNTELLKKFTRNLMKYFKRKNIIFLKINPLIPIAEINKNNNYERITNSNIEILDILKELGFKKRKETKPLELIEPKLTSIINLKKFDFNSISEDIKKRIDISNNNGLEIINGDINNLETIFELAKDTTKEDITYYNDFYNEFNNNNNVDLLLVKVNYETYLINAKKRVEDEQIKNDEINEKFKNDTSEEIYEQKMKSDKDLETYKQDVIFATNGLKNNNDIVIMGALIVKWNNKITILLSGKDNNYDYLYPDYYLYYNIIEKYKEKYDVLDFYSIADDFDENSIYYNSNKVKTDFSPIITEYIGELDLVISEWKFKILERNNLLSNEFNN